MRLYDFGVSEAGSLYFVMELLDGLDLFSLVQRFGPLPPERVVSVLRQACRSLAEAHEAGLLHRDMPERAAIFVDGRYTLQAKAEVDAALFEQRHISDQPARVDRRGSEKRAGARLRSAPAHAREVERYRAAAEKAGGKLCRSTATRSMRSGPTGPRRRWRRSCRMNYVCRRVQRRQAQGNRRRLAEDEIDAAVLTAPNSIAWLLNIRGGDVPYTPLPLIFAIFIADESVDLFIDAAQADARHPAFLGNAVRTSAAGAVRRDARKPPRQARPRRSRLGRLPGCSTVSAGGAASSRRRSVPVAESLQECGRARWQRAPRIAATARR